MKKLFYLLAAGAILCSCSDSKEDTPIDTTPEFGAGSLTFGYCADEILFTTGINSPGSTGEIGGAIYIPAETAALWKGNSLSAVIVGFGSSSNPTAKIFVSEGKLDGVDMPTPVLTQEAEMEMQNDWNEVTLDTPYEITGETGFYVGYTSLVNYGDRPLALDTIFTDEQEEDNGDFIGINQNINLAGNTVEWVHGGPWFGRICLQLVISGNNLPLYNVTASDVFFPDFVGQNEDFPVDIYIQNNGMKAVESVTVQLTSNGKVLSEGEAVAEVPVETGESAWLSVQGLSCNEIGENLNITANIIKVNGSSRILPSNSSTGQLSCSDISFEKNPVFEEFTGTWCGWCPRGIVGMEHMTETYGNSFLGIAGHYQDEMQSNSYVQVVNTFSQGSYPSAVVDRTYYFDPSASTLEEYYTYLKQYASPAQLTMDVNYDSAAGEIVINSTSEFAFDNADATYRVAFVLCQNNVGPYIQQNYFAGGSNGANGGWENMGSVVSWIYNEVARDIIDPYGVLNSLPTSITKGTPYTYSCSFPVTTQNINEYYVVGMILDASTSRVVNGARYSFGSSETKATRSTESVKILKSETISRIRESQRSQKAEKKEPVISRSTSPMPSTLRAL